MTNETMSREPASRIPTPKIENDCYDWYERHESRLKLVSSHKYDLVFIGDSITHFWEGDAGADYGSNNWKRNYGHRRALNLGYGFDRTQNVLWRLAHGEMEGQNPEIIVLNIGTNQFSATQNYPCDTPENAAGGIIKVIETLRKMFPATHLIVMALFPRGGKKELIDSTNAIIGKYAAENPGFDYLDIGRELSLPNGEPRKELYMGCLCHLSEAGYDVWSSALEPYIKKYLDREK